MKLGKRLMSLALALVMVFGLTVNVSAATTQNIKVQLSSNITVKYNGEIQSMTDVNGTPVYPLLNGGTTYLPVRAVSNMLGVDVDWDGATQTVILTDPAGGRKPVPSTGSTSAKPAPSTVTVQLSPGITVKYNGKVQSMTDVNGTPVYPLLNGGTTYLPIRAVSNMLGLNVDWDGATQTVYLAQPRSSGTSTDSSAYEHEKSTITIERPTVERIRKTMEMYEYSEEAIESAIAEFVATDPNGTDTFTYTVINDFTTSKDAKVLGDKHVACDYAEVDYSMADEGYVKVKLTKQAAKLVKCNVVWANSSLTVAVDFPLKLDQWVKIPLLGGSDKYKLTIERSYSKAEQDSTTLYELLSRKDFKVAFNANIEDPDAFMLMSHAGVDFENAPKTIAKAAELTKDCKTDAEKITAIFEFVAKTIKYDHKLVETERKQNAAGDIVVVRTYDLDDILESKTGVCEHYAILMAGMLRSQGIPCKVVSGKVNYPNIDFPKHAWVSVSPDTKGLNMSRLGAGHDEDGWIRLDPTWGGTSAGRADAAIDKNHESFYAY